MSDRISAWVDNGDWVVEFVATKEPCAVWYFEGESLQDFSHRDWVIDRSHLRIRGPEDVWGLRLLLDEIEKEFRDETSS